VDKRPVRRDRIRRRHRVGTTPLGPTPVSRARTSSAPRRQGIAPSRSASRSRKGATATLSSPGGQSCADAHSESLRTPHPTHPRCDRHRRRQPSPPPRHPPPSDALEAHGGGALRGASDRDPEAAASAWRGSCSWPLWRARIGIWLRRRRRRETPAPPAPTPTRDTSSSNSPTILVETGARSARSTCQGVLGGADMATTYRARRGSDGQAVALKVRTRGACPTRRSSPASCARELGEQLHHPRIVRIFAAGQDKGRPFLAMEVVEGHTLNRRSASAPRSPLSRPRNHPRHRRGARLRPRQGRRAPRPQARNVMLLPDGRSR